jgi:toxin CptA
LIVVIAVAWLIGGVGLWVWRARSGLPPTSLGLTAQLFNGLVFCVWLACGALAAGHWWFAPQGLLRWDGLAWHWEPAPGAPEMGGQLFVALDAQRLLLLGWRPVRVNPSGYAMQTVRWLWLNRKDHHERWHLLRCAVYSRAADPTPEPT